MQLLHKFCHVVALPEGGFDQFLRLRLSDSLLQHLKKMGKERKLSSKDEYLLTVMKLRLGLQTMDLAVTFIVSDGSCSNIFLTWLQAVAECFKTFVFIRNLETVLATSAESF